MGRGSSGVGESLGSGGPQNIQIDNEVDVWSYRHNRNNEAFVDEINGGVRTIQEDFPGVMNDVQRVEVASFGGKDGPGVLGVHTSDGVVALNRKYTDVERMNRVYDAGGDYHPGRGNRSAVEAVTLHEMGHALNDHLGKKTGRGMDATAKDIVDSAYRNSNGRGGTKKWAGKISGYAQESNAECIAEAVADWYCNGSGASSASKAIMTELRRVYNS